VLATIRSVLRAAATTVVPEASQLGESEWATLEGIVLEALTRRPPAVQRQFLIFLRLVEWLPLLRYGRRFTALDPERRRRFLEALQDAPLLLVRRGAWGLRTLLLMGYHGRPAAAHAIGYRADARGWKAPR